MLSISSGVLLCTTCTTSSLRRGQGVGGQWERGVGQHTEYQAPSAPSGRSLEGCLGPQASSCHPNPKPAEARAGHAQPRHSCEMVCQLLAPFQPSGRLPCPPPAPPQPWQAISLHPSQPAAPYLPHSLVAFPRFLHDDMHDLALHILLDLLAPVPPLLQPLPEHGVVGLQHQHQVEPPVAGAGRKGARPGRGAQQGSQGRSAPAYTARPAVGSLGCFLLGALATIEEGRQAGSSREMACTAGKQAGSHPSHLSGKKSQPW